MRSILKISLILISISSFNGCSSPQIAPECLWYVPVKLSDTDKAVLSRDGKEQIARNNLNYMELCP